jgi:hypothetical protein
MSAVLRITLFESETLPGALVATAAVTIAFQPLRDRIQRMINRLMFGERDDPYKVMRTLDLSARLVASGERGPAARKALQRIRGRSEFDLRAGSRLFSMESNQIRCFPESAVLIHVICSLERRNPCCTLPAFVSRHRSCAKTQPRSTACPDA